MLIQIVLESIPQIKEAIAPLAVGLIIGGIQTALGAYQKFKSDQALKAIAEEEKAKFEVSPGLERSRIRALELLESGVPEARAAFSQGLASEGESAFRRMTDIGRTNPEFAAIAIQARNIAAIGKFEGTQIPRLKRIGARDVYDVEKQIQQQRNLATQEAIADRLRREQAFGQAGQAGLENIVGGLTTGFALGTGGLGGGAGSTTGLTSRQFVPQSVDEFTTLNRSQLSIQGLQ